MVELTVNVATIADKLRWDEYVDNHPDSTPYHRFAWQEAVQSAYGHSMAGVIATNSVNKQVCGVFPAVLMKSPFSHKHLCALPYCDLGHGLADAPEVIKQMQQRLSDIGKNSGSRILEVRKHTTAPYDLSALAGQKVRMVLPLPSSGELLLQSFKSKLRSQIKKAQKNGLTVRLGNTQNSINEFYDVYAQNMRDLGSPVHAKRWFEEIVDGYDKNAIISVVFHDEKPIGAGIVLCNKQTASIPWASTLREFNRLAPNMLLYWSLLEHCANNGIEHFDFGRSTFNEGTYRFKKQWGAEPQLLIWDRFDLEGKQLKQPSQVQKNSRLRPFVEKVWCKLPLALTVRVGGFIRPYISL
ncbi:GNAT family N-acetyltransferase [Alteromonas sp. 345S023]|uniref:GNAT family N-acetyltransferase n=1 Tax=Alteromonas profundi TaxID=2696062 RepID=A0A7X5RKW6_9ALTE|nr:GNAT family N-acetyltransferase [Alteromonas profundi]NDV91413.1 GNAT family N-acetyltransferase [Alteromonas profundi]